MCFENNGQQVADSRENKDKTDFGSRCCRKSVTAAGRGMPPIIVFFVGQRYFVEGVTLTGIKM
jgi:hypothetical protein